MWGHGGFWGVLVEISRPERTNSYIYNAMRSGAPQQVRFEELGAQRSFVLPELEERSRRNPWDEKRQQYRVWLGEQEAAFMTFDIFWENELNLYELFVATSCRGMGVGTAAVAFAINLAKTMRKPRLSIRAIPLSDQSQEQLIAWYVRRGLRPSADDPELLVIDTV